MTQSDDCAPPEAPRLIFACSGAADVGRVADLTARTLTREGVGSMFCLAGVGGRVPDIMERTATASKILAIDGCSLGCTKSCLAQAGFANVEHLKLEDLGMEKGKTEATEETIRRAVDAGAMLLA